MFRTQSKQIREPRISKDVKPKYMLTAEDRIIPWDKFKSALEKNGVPKTVAMLVGNKKRTHKITYSNFSEGIATVEAIHEEKVRRPPESLDETLRELKLYCSLSKSWTSSLNKTIEEMGFPEVKISEEEKKDSNKKLKDILAFGSVGIMTMTTSAVLDIMNTGGNTKTILLFLGYAFIFLTATRVFEYKRKYLKNTDKGQR